ncbi:MAG: hypothetical protein AAGN66_30360 [Acidobacteriota bacterium]
MGNELQDLVAALDADLEDQLVGKLRAQLEAKDRAWLVDALVQRVLQDRHLHEAPGRRLTRQARHVEPLAERRKRLERIRGMALTEDQLRETKERLRALDRGTLEAEGYLVDAPHKGKEALRSRHRSAAGEALLQEAHDLFYALLFCDERQGVQLRRTRRDFLTVTLPSVKAGSLERFMLAVTEMEVQGTWLDPEGVSDDIGATNKILQVEFGDSDDDAVSDGLLVALGMINDLEVNEEILYARTEELERSTLVG